MSLVVLQFYNLNKNNYCALTSEIVSFVVYSGAVNVRPEESHHLNRQTCNKGSRFIPFEIQFLLTPVMRTA